MQTYQNLVCKTVYFEVYGFIVVKLERFKSYAGRQRLTNADINKSGGNADIFLDSMLIISGGDYVYLRRKD